MVPKTLKNYILKFSKTYFQIFLPLSLAFIFARTVEFLFLINRGFTYHNILRSYSYAIEFDLILFGVIGLSIFPLSLLLKKISIKIFNNFHLIFGSLLILLNTLFTKFFLSSHYLLDISIFSFSWEEIKLIISGDQFVLFSLSSLTYLTGIIAGVIYVVSFKSISKKEKLNHYFPLAFFIILSALFIFRMDVNPHHNSKYSYYETKLHSSKITHFLSSVIEHYSKNDQANVDYITLIKNYREHTEQETTSSFLAFPFCKKLDTNRNDVWKPYIHRTDSMNIVMIYLEGMSSEFIGDSSKYRGGTPFLDSLAKKSLYWPNMLSITDRTHGVFAATLGGLPHGYERGFLNLKNYPLFLSLPHLLQKRNYNFNFFYGGDAYFDSYLRFLKKLNFSNIVDLGYMEKNYQLKGNNTPEKFSWGLHDKKVAQSYFRFMDENTNTQPYFNLWLTLSLHSPFDIPNKAHYIERTKTQFEHLGSGFVEYNKDVLSSLCYTDDALRAFFEDYKKREDYKNTVFILMGDHAVLNLNNTDVLGLYNVPLIVFSPLQKEVKTFHEIISHWDIPQSLMELIDKDFNKKNLMVNWLGAGMKFSQKCSASEPIYLGTFKGDLYGVCWKDYLLMHDKLYHIHGDFELEEVENQEIKHSYQALLSEYELLNSYTIEQEKIYPLQAIISLNEDGQLE